MKTMMFQTQVQDDPVQVAEVRDNLLRLGALYRAKDKVQPRLLLDAACGEAGQEAWRRDAILKELVTLRMPARKYTLVCAGLEEETCDKLGVLLGRYLIDERGNGVVEYAVHVEPTRLCLFTSECKVASDGIVSHPPKGPLNDHAKEEEWREISKRFHEFLQALPDSPDSC